MYLHPVKQTSAYPLTSPIGMRTLPGVGAHFHTGIDIACPTGTRVVAITDSVVHSVLTTAHSGGFGEMITLAHSDGKFSRYCHLQAGTIVVKNGQAVKAGQEIAKSGNTGFSGGPHLHFEIRTDTTYGKASVLNPLELIEGAWEWAFEGLQQGSPENGRVRALQERIKSFLRAPIEIDGDWGKDTTAALGFKRINHEALLHLGFTPTKPV